MVPAFHSTNQGRPRYVRGRSDHGPRAALTLVKRSHSTFAIELMAIAPSSSQSSKLSHECPNTSTKNHRRARAAVRRSAGRCVARGLPTPYRAEMLTMGRHGSSPGGRGTAEDRIDSAAWTSDASSSEPGSRQRRSTVVGRRGDRAHACARGGANAGPGGLVRGARTQRSARPGVHSPRFLRLAFHALQSNMRPDWRWMSGGIVASHFESIGESAASSNSSAGASSPRQR